MIGIDIVSISRIEKMVNKFGEKCLKKFLTDNEIKIAKKIETIAGFWASKEAIAKALKTGIGNKLSFHDIEIFKDINNAPYFELNRKISQKYNIKEYSLSISHDGGFAIAVAILM